jgi:hypothetical protein
MVACIPPKQHAFFISSRLQFHQFLPASPKYLQNLSAALYYVIYITMARHTLRPPTYLRLFPEDHGEQELYHVTTTIITRTALPEILVYTFRNNPH